MSKHSIFFLKILLAPDYMSFVNGNVNKAMLKLISFIFNSILPKLRLGS